MGCTWGVGPAAEEAFRRGQEAILKRERPRRVDRGRDVSDELTEVRTVLSRAETALRAIKGAANRETTLVVNGTAEARRYGIENQPGIHRVPYRQDPDRAEMEEALKSIVRQLDRWRKTGRPR